MTGIVVDHSSLTPVSLVHSHGRPFSTKLNCAIGRPTNILSQKSFRILGPKCWFSVQDNHKHLKKDNFKTTYNTF